MTSVLVYLRGPSAPVLRMADLQAAGLVALATLDEHNKLVQEVVRHAPDLVICELARPDDAFFKAIKTVAETAPCPVMVFTSEPDAERITQALDAGVHAYVINGYGKDRLRALVQLAQARFRHECTLRKALDDVTTRFEERKVVDRAKLILMRARQLSDDDAFRVLRTASMHSNQRLGQVSEHIIHSAHFAEGVNRAGQLRMLSQRLVKLYALHLLEPSGSAVLASAHRQQLKDSVQRIDANLAFLGKGFSEPTFGDLTGRVKTNWSGLKNALQMGPQAAEMAAVDALAEQLLEDAERLTASLESAAACAEHGRPATHVVAAVRQICLAWRAGRPRPGPAQRSRGATKPQRL
ncbi:MAG: ANTAR domain-containing protein [Pseudomonadota bacterium]